MSRSGCCCWARCVEILGWIWKNQGQPLFVAYWNSSCFISYLIPFANCFIAKCSLLICCIVFFVVSPILRIRNKETVLDGIKLSLTWIYQCSDCSSSSFKGPMSATAIILFRVKHPNMQCLRTRFWIFFGATVSLILKILL